MSTGRCRPCAARTPERRAASARVLRNIPHDVLSRAGRIGARNIPREAKVRGGRIGGRNPSARESKVQNGRNIPHEVRVRNGCKLVENGQLFKNGRGIPSASPDGEYLMASIDEATAYGILLELGGEPYVPLRIDLSDGRSYYPDIAVRRSVLGLPANVPIELKRRKSPWTNNGTIEKAREVSALVVYYEDLWE